MIHDQSMQRRRSRIRGLFGVTAPTDAPADAHTPVEGERARLLDAIRDFLLGNNLDISAANLLAAHAAFSGGNPRLRRRIGERIAAGEAISQFWLDQQLRDDGKSDPATHYEDMAVRLQSSVERFRDTTSSARNAVVSYGRDIASQVETLAREKPAATSLLREKSQGMAETARTFEKRLMRAEREAQALREELARARRDATIDPLTQLPNRRGFEAVFEEEFRMARSNVEAMCVAFCDIDRFKRINDSFGHDTGDRVIVAVGELLKTMGTGSCHAARHGGEEFVMIFRGFTTEQARERIDAMRIALGKRRFVQESTGDVIGKVSFSAGVADVFAFPDRRNALRAADEALYRAKEAGRDRVEIAG